MIGNKIRNTQLLIELTKIIQRSIEPIKTQDKTQLDLPKEEIGKSIPIGEARDWLLSPESQTRIGQHLNRYLTSYSGRHFEAFSALGAGPKITSWDVLAAESLSVAIPPDVVLWISRENRERDQLLNSLYESLVLGKQKIWTCHEQVFADNEDLSKLYKMLKEHKNMSYVKSSKLLAAKFPEVVPIRDSKVEMLLGLRSSERWWLDIRNLFLDDGGLLATHLDRLPIPPECGPITTLRRLDIILWMEAKARRIPSRQRTRGG
jgi:hypothetical protein